jgi:hypothetical protein
MMAMADRALGTAQEIINRVAEALGPEEEGEEEEVSQVRS